MRTVGNMNTRAPGARVLLVLPAAAILLLGLSAGLLLLGVPMPVVSERLPELHAPLLVFGFVGALICLERAVALRVAWAYAAPALLLAGMLLTLTPLPLIVGQACVVAGTVCHVLQYVAIWRRQPMTATAVQAVGAASASVAAVAWCGGVPSSRLVPLLAAFLVLTIAGERLELARVSARVSGQGLRAERVLFVLTVLLASTALLSLTVPTVAVPAAGVALLAMTAWLLRYDVARATVRMPGLPRYVACCLFAGYAWLAVAGAGWLLGGARTQGAVYDATTHAIFLGFVITMIMAHAPIILPAVLGVRIPFHVALHAPVAVLQVSLLTRVVAGDAWGFTPALQAGGIGAVVAMLGFGVTAVSVSLRARRTGPGRTGPRRTGPRRTGPGRTERSARVTA